MARLIITSRLAKLALAAMSLLSLASAATETCYLPSGDEAPGGILPCGSTSSGNATQCCGGSDYCLNNGLCLNAGGSNEITQQGCTDKDWGNGCKKYCATSDINPNDNYFYLIYCVTLNSTDAGYCCGTDRSCCSATDDLISIPLFSSATHPSTSDADDGDDTTNTPVTTPAPTSTPNTATGSEESNAGSSNQDSGVTQRVVGLAVGISLGFFAMVAVCTWLYFRHRRNQQLQQLKERDHHMDTMGGAAAVSRGAERDSGMRSIEYKEPPASAISAKSPPPVHERRTPGASSASPISTPATAVSSTLPTYTPGARGYYDPDKPVPDTPSESVSAGVVGHEPHFHEQHVAHEPHAAELHGQHAAYEMSGEPAGPPLELDTAASVARNAGPSGTNNHKYRF